MVKLELTGNLHKGEGKGEGGGEGEGGGREKGRESVEVPSYSTLTDQPTKNSNLLGA